MIKTDMERLKFGGGFTFVELLMVIVVLGIVMSIAVVAVQGILKKAEVDVCAVNRTEIGRLYEEYLVLEGLEHHEVLFEDYVVQFGDGVCQIGGHVECLDGTVECSVHADDGGSVPIL